MDMTLKFWQNWLLAVCAIIIIFGCVIGLLSWSPLFGIFNGLVNNVFWPGSSPDESVKTFQLWAYGMLGATMVGWGCVLAYIVWYPFAKREAWAWNCIAFGVSAWFIIDTFMSVYTNALFNVIVNILILILVTIPLLMSRKYFTGHVKP
jgi:hypothetical protein